MNLVPVMDKIIVEPEKMNGKTAGGVFLPDGSRESKGVGRIVSMGVGGWDKKRNMPIPMPAVKPGDRIIYRTWAGSALAQEMTTGGKALIVMEPADVLCRIDE